MESADLAFLKSYAADMKRHLEAAVFKADLMLKSLENPGSELAPDAAALAQSIHLASGHIGGFREYLANVGSKTPEAPPADPAAPAAPATQ